MCFLGRLRLSCVRLSEQFSIIEKFKEELWLCEVFEVHRSSYRYWANRDKSLSSGRVLVCAEVRRAYELSNGSAGAITIADLVTARGILIQSKKDVILPFCINELKCIYMHC